MNFAPSILLTLAPLFGAAAAQADPSPVPSPLSLPAAKTPQEEGLRLQQIEGSTLVFGGLPAGKLPAPLKTGLQEIRVIGFLQPDDSGSLAYVLLSAKSGEDRALHLIRVDGGKQTQLVHPGRIVDTKTGVKVLDSQAFYGKCRSDYGPSYMSFQVEVVDKKRHGRKVRATEASFLVLEPLKENFKEKLDLVRSVSALEQKKRETLKFVKRKECFLVDGRNRTIATGPVNMKLRRDLEDDDDNDEDESPTPGASDAPEKSQESK